MARVPVYGQRRVETAPLPNQQRNPNAPSAAFGVQGPNVVGQVANALTPLVEREIARADRLAITEAENALHQVDTDLSTQAQQQFRGKDALGATAWAEGERTKRVSEIAAGLNGRQRELFTMRAGQSWQQVRSKLEGYGHQEFERHEADVFGAGLQIRLNDARTDPTAAPAKLAEARAMVATFGQQRGWSPEQVQEKQGAVASRLHAGVIESMLAQGNDLAAEQYAKTHIAEITGDERTSVQKMLEVGTRLGKAQRNADRILATEGITKTQAYALAKEIEDPQERQDAERELDTQFRRIAEAERADYETLSEQAFSAAVNTGRVPANLLSRLKAKDQVAVRDFLRSQTEGRPIETDWGAYYDLKTLAATAPDRFRRENLLSYRGKLGETEFKELVTLQTKVRGGDSNPDEVRGFRTVRESVVDALPTDVKPESEEGRAVMRAVDQEVVAWKRANPGKEISNEEARRITAQVVRREVQVRGRLGRTSTRPARDVKPEDRAKAFVPFFSIPAADRTELTRLFQQLGRAPTMDHVQRAYAARLMGDTELLQEILTGDY